MKTINVTQGSPEWLALRTNHNTASEASAMMGCSPYKTRSQLLKEKHTGLTEDVDAATQKRFDRGHQIEEAARPIAEKIIGDELFPATALDDDGELLASFDGITMLEDAVWECKTFNKSKAEEVAIGDIPAADFWQCIQQLYVSGAEKLLYTLSDGTEEGSVHCWLTRERAADFFGELVAGWKQFSADLADYQPEEAKTEVVAEVHEDLPAVSVRVSGDLEIVDDFDRFSKALHHFIDNVLITDPKTDQDFADLESQIKTLKKAEQALDAAEAQLLSQVEAVDAAKKAKDMLSDLTRKYRLQSEKLMKAQKQAIKLQIAQDGRASVDQHVATINSSLDGVVLPQIITDYNTAMKGKRTIASLRDAADTETARAKILATETAELIRANLTLLAECGNGFLFADRQQLVLKQPDDLKAVITARVAEHEAAERKKEEARREQIRREEQAKAEAEARQKLEAEQAAQQQTEAEQKQEAPSSAQPVQAEAKSEEPARYAATERPTDNQILAVISAEWGVSMEVAADWVLGMNTDKLQEMQAA